MSFSPENRLQDKIVIKSKTSLKSIYLKFSDSSDDLMFQDILTSSLKSSHYGYDYKILSFPEGASLVVKLDVQRIESKSGNLYLDFGIKFPTVPPESVHEVEGLQVNAQYITDTGKWHTIYRSFSGNRSVVDEIIYDINHTKIIGKNNN
jgi:hypothetical protein